MKKRKLSSSVQDGVLKHFRLVATSTSECVQPMLSATNGDMVADVSKVPNFESTLEML